MLILLAVLGGIAIGAVMAWLTLRGNAEALGTRAASLDKDCAELKEQINILQAGNSQLSIENAQLSTSLSEKEQRYEAELAQYRDSFETRDRERQRALEILSAELVELRKSNETLSAENASISASLSEKQAAFESQVAQLRSSFEEQKKLLIEEAEPRWLGFFKNQSREALSENRADFLREARQSINPLGESLERLQGQINELGKSEATLQHQLKQLHSGTTDLIHAIRGKPQLRGNWGELILRDIVEFVGMVDHCHFVEQAAVEDGRPDMIINLPQNRQVAVDSKHVVEAYWPVAEAATAGDSAAYMAARKDFAGKVRRRLDELSRREYWKKISSNLDYVVMFVPAEAHYREAIEADGSLMEYAAKNNVLLLSPLTLLALMRMMATTWREHRQIEFAHEMVSEAKKFYERASRFHGRLAATGQAIDNLVAKYDEAVTAWDGKQGLMRLADNVGKLGAGDGKPVGELAPIDRTTRALETPALIFDASQEATA